MRRLGNYSWVFKIKPDSVLSVVDLIPIFGVSSATSVRKAESSKENRLVWVSHNTFQLELLPVFCFGADMQGLDNFAAQLSEDRR